MLLALAVGGTLLRLVSAAPDSTDSGHSAGKNAHWSFQALRPPTPPTVTNEAWCQTPLDRFILARLETDGLRPAPAAEKRSLIRRATFDLTGLPPSADEVDAFVADESPDAFARLVDRLLDSPHYGEQWGRHWLDVVRYADTAGETADYPVPEAWRYRNYVIDAVNADKPYDQFLREQIAGDILARQGPRERYAERVTATGYLAISRRFGFDSENYHHLTIQDTIDTVGQSVLGLTLGCARCHAHKFDPVSMPEYYALYGIFDSTRYAFPGSEQKQKSRALVPLVPPGESLPRWREFENRIAALTRTIERQKKSAPTAVLRSLDDLDGDFEMQAPAAGGSKGVLVPPWLYEGPIAVTTEAQSPYKNLYPLGRVGAAVSGATNGYRIAQALHPTRSQAQGGRLYVNLDVRIATNEPASRGVHRFWIGAQPSLPAFEVLLAPDTLSLRTGDRTDPICALRPAQWHNLQLVLDLSAGTVSGRVGRPGDLTEFAPRPLAATWNGILDFVSFDSAGAGGYPLAPLALDNLGVQESPLAPVSTTPVPLAGADDAVGDSADPQTELRQLAGLDGDFELQSDDTPPVSPWGPGPKSVVSIQAGSQSPFRNLYPAGRLGIQLPNSGAYNGFGQTLPRRWEAARTDRLFTAFDFRSAKPAAGGGGSWRFYLGHGAGSSPAIELFFNDREFFRRSGDARDAVAPLKTGEWYQVQVALDLKQKRYTGSLTSASGRTEFSGEMASGWDGSIDYTFIDSYGHVDGVKPALDADNFVVREAPLPPLGGPPAVLAQGESDSRRARVGELRRQIARQTAEADQARRELEELLVNGPFELTYGVSEGTPHNSRIQLRGEPDKPGDEVPRGFLRVLGGQALAPETRGSGRLELADWLASPSNPLTARVMVNRIWQYHFGQGLVKTPNDFGTRGQPPTHPELLDYLAAEFIRGGWSIKALHRLIMTSAVYQQGSQSSVVSNQSSVVSNSEDCPVIPNAIRSRPRLNTDPLNTDSFSPFPRRRLGAEETRDQILLASGELDPRPGGAHPFPPPTGWGFSQHGPFNAVYDNNRRSVYLMTQRIKRHPFLALFDGADPNSSTATRRVTTVPTQALYFLNDPFVHASAEKFAARVASAGKTETEQVNAAYRRALGRNATPAELAEAAEFLAAYRAELKSSGAEPSPNPALAAFARVLFGSNEFLTVD